MLYEIIHEAIHETFAGGPAVGRSVPLARPEVHVRTDAHRKSLGAGLVLVLSLLLLPGAPGNVIAQEGGEATLARPQLGPYGVSFQGAIAADGWVLTVTGPAGFHLRKESSDRPPAFSLSDVEGEAVDGFYSWELRPVFEVDEELRRSLDEERRAGEAGVAERLRRAAGIPDVPPAISGQLRVVSKRVVQPDVEERTTGPSSETVLADPRGVLSNSDAVIRSSLCVGIDCPNTPNFGFTTVLLMENNTRFKFDDTSTTGSFPRRDWTIGANDTNNGGAERFFIQDCGVSSQGNCGGNIVFTIEAGAPSNALRVDSAGNLGMGTSNPVVEMHSIDGDTPALRLDQDTSSGFQAQIWDVAGNETNFFVRDVTNGSNLPFSIRPGAPDRSVDIRTDSVRVNNSMTVGASTVPDSTILHVRDTNSTPAPRRVLKLENNGVPQLELIDANAGNSWLFHTLGDSFIVNKVGSGTNQMRVFPNGNVVIAGTLSEGSSRSVKTELTPVDSGFVLSRIVELPLMEWSYEADVEGIRHVGPMAEDFYGAFSLGVDEKHVAPRDVAGVALAGIQGLHEILETQAAELARYAERVQALEARIAELERLIEESSRRR